MLLPPPPTSSRRRGRRKEPSLTRRGRVGEVRRGKGGGRVGARSKGRGSGKRSLDVEHQNVPLLSAFWFRLGGRKGGGGGMD